MFFFYYIPKQMASFFKTTIVCILICLDISLLVASTLDFNGELGRGSTKRFCGKMLTDSLALICNNEYQSFIPVKRSGKHGCTRFFFSSRKSLFVSYQNEAHSMSLIHDLSIFFIDPITFIQNVLFLNF